MAKSVTKYVCQKCGYASVKWLGKCPECGAWDSLVEEVDAPVDRHRRDDSRLSGRQRRQAI